MKYSNNLYHAQEFNNIKEIIYNSVEQYSKNIAFVIKHTENKKVEYENITYKQLLEDINKLGTAVYSLGFKRKRIAVIGRNSYEWAIAHLSNLLGGNVSVPLDKDLQYDELESSLIRSKADMIFFDKKYEEKICQIKEKNNTNLKEYVCFEEAEGFKNISELLKIGNEEINSGKTDFINAKIDENEMAILLFTSGTTSKSKAVMLSQKNIASNVYAMKCVEAIYSTDTNIAFLPFHHIFGSTCMVVMLAYGVRTVFPDGLRYIKKNLNEYGVSVFVGVPVLVEAIYKTIMKEVQKQGKTKLVNIATKISNFLLKLHIDLRRILFKSIINELGGKLRFVISGGAPADSKIAKGFNDLGIEVVKGYGLTETSPVIAAENKRCMKAGTVGIPMLNVKLEIENPDENGIGEIRVKGPNVMLGYYENEEATKDVLKDGWFYTGDLGYLDKNGCLAITGRSKNLIVLKNGKKVFPEELETLVNRLELVEECMVYGMPDEKDKNDVKLSIKVVYNKEIVKEKYSDKTEEELYKIIWNEIKEINKTLPRYKYIKGMILTDEELIKTTTKKVKRQEEMKKIMA